MGVTGPGMAEGGGRRKRGRKRRTEDEKVNVGRGCVRAPELLRGRGCRLGSAPTMFVTEENGGLESTLRGVSRSIWKWVSSRIQNLTMVSTPAIRTGPA